MSSTKDLRFNKMIFAAVLAVVFILISSQVAFASENDEYYDSYWKPAEFVTTVNLNLRGGPGVDYDRITLIPTGSLVLVVEYNPAISDNDYAFSNVMFGETQGYVASRYIVPRAEVPQATIQTVTQTAPQTTPAIPAEMNGNIENIAWSTMRDTGIIPIGTTIQIYDIRSGLTYYVRNFSNGSHADVETLTVQDTETMRQTSGGFSWDARPVLATFNGRTFAAAIHTMPHAGSTIHTNGMNGHICLHFLGSRPHNGNRSWEAEMQTAVTQAFNSR